MLTITSAFLLGLAAGVGAQPRISTSDGDVILASPTDVRVVRQDPDGDGSGRSRSLFGMIDQVEALPSTIATAVSTLRDDISTSGAAQTRAFEGFLSGNLSAVSARLNATVADLDRLNVTVDAAVTNNGNVQAALARTDSALRSSISALESAAVASASCFAAGMVMTSTGCGYPPVMTDRVAGYTCTNSTFGRTRWNHNVSFYEVCSPGATGIPIFQPVYRPPPYGSEGNPAASGAALLANRPNAGSGLYWIQPAGDALPAETYCDMVFRGGGWCLADIGWVQAPNADSRNRNMINLNRPNGYNWRPTSRRSTHMLINLPSGAVNMAKASTTMMMAAGNNPSSGGINNYAYAYEVSISHVTQFLHFKNGNKFHLGCRNEFGLPRNQNTNFVVRGVKGDIGTWTKRSQREGLMLSWGDSFPSGYGFSNQGISAGTHMACSTGWTDGPFFPTLHCGDGNGGYSGRWGQTSSPPDITNGKAHYTHRGWYGASQYGRTGQTSIWFK